MVAAVAEAVAEAAIVSIQRRNLWPTCYPLVHGQPPRCTSLGCTNVVRTQRRGGRRCMKTDAGTAEGGHGGGGHGGGGYGGNVVPSEASLENFGNIGEGLPCQTVQPRARQAVLSERHGRPEATAQLPAAIVGKRAITVLTSARTPQSRYAGRRCPSRTQSITRLCHRSAFIPVLQHAARGPNDCGKGDGCYGTSGDPTKADFKCCAAGDQPAGAAPGC